MTTKDARTPASAHDSVQELAEAGKSIGWHKAYAQGSRPDLRVPVRQVHLTNGQSVTLYDTSGPYTDPLVDTDVRRGLPPLRE
ncbi:phosphomethylpyrimidine synthase ThiC, partial [Streptomyces sp. TRM76130]|nr:phosphomethylpyrimidine synthase ThiC [Streptomyces sp. TRM76130]